MKAKAVARARKFVVNINEADASCKTNQEPYISRACSTPWLEFNFAGPFLVHPLPAVQSRFSPRQLMKPLRMDFWGSSTFRSTEKRLHVTLTFGASSGAKSFACPQLVRTGWRTSSVISRDILQISCEISEIRALKFLKEAGAARFGSKASFHLFPESQQNAGKMVHQCKYTSASASLLRVWMGWRT